MLCDFKLSLFSEARAYHTVSALILRRVQVYVCLVNQRLNVVGTAVRRSYKTDGERSAQLFIVKVKDVRVNRVNNPPANCVGVNVGVEQYQKFVSAPAAQISASVEGVIYRVTYILNNNIAVGMPEAVVNQLEVIDVENCHRGRLDLIFFGFGYN